MIALVLVALLAGAAASPDRRMALVHGHRAIDLNLNQVTALLEYYVGTDVFVMVHQCTGVVVGIHHILTAAHCLYHEGHLVEPKNLRVTVDHQLASVVDLKVHPMFNMTVGVMHGPRYDLGMVITDAVFGSVAPLPPSANGLVPMVGDALVMGGYGTDEDGMYGVLKYATMMALPMYSPGCYEELYGPCYQDYTDLFVAGGFDGYVCMGDSGGPIFDTNHLVGILSMGFECSSVCGYPMASFVRVYDYLDIVYGWM